MTDEELGRIAAETGLCSRCGRMTADLVAEVRQVRSDLYTKWERLCEVMYERDEARAEVERLKAENRRLNEQAHWRQGRVPDDSSEI